MNLGIYAPYHRGEITAAALRVAELALALAFNVRWLSPEPTQGQVHPFWDRQVVTCRTTKDLYRWASNCQQLIWFEPDASRLEQTKLVAEHTEQTLVLFWHSIRQQSCAQIQKYDRIITTGRDAREQLLLNAFPSDPEHEVHSCVWDSGLPPVRKTRQFKDGCSLLVPLDGDTAKLSGSFILRCLHDLLNRHRNLEVTLSHDTSLSRPLRRALRLLVDIWDTRFKVCAQTSGLSRIPLYHAHDWTFVPNLNSSIGLQALTSLSCGTPVIAYDIDPFSSIISNGHNGALIECNLHFNWLQAPMAEPHIDSTLDALSEIIKSPTLLQRVHRADWKLIKRQADFVKFWAAEWDVEL